MGTGTSPSEQRSEPVVANAAADPDQSLPSIQAPSPAELADVARHVKDALPRDLYDNFKLIVYVSKASSGRWAQHMFVFQKEDTGNLVLRYDWPVSTGRERDEFNDAGALLPSVTPEGYFQLDPGRMYTSHRSNQWGTLMPYAMFFKWTGEGHPTGLAIHAATEDEVSFLGTRASAGCVRLPPEAAHSLFHLIHSEYRQPTPMLEIDFHKGATSTGGNLHLNVDGSIKLADGYSVLVFIEDYGDGHDVALLP
jgi:hypothetical protein